LFESVCVVCGVIATSGKEIKILAKKVHDEIQVSRPVLGVGEAREHTALYK
jgi:hypothetical protein